MPATPTERVEAWFAERGWTPFPFQREVWRRYRDGESGLIHAATGTGKTLAAWLGPVLEWIGDYPEAGPADEPEDLRVLWITPLRALAADTETALKEPVAELGLPWTVERRTSDTGASVKRRQ
ncbi:MAG: DEAD/DEAH box helicase, partial [Rhodothermales bacterium]|nr:DEAD/DEAH box helicase [Rhodothermales bacterium]